MNPYAACVVKFGHAGKWHLYLNASTPEGHHYSEGICKECGNAYSHMLGSEAERCNECEGDRIAIAGMSLERQGIPLGWGVLDHTKEYERESHQQHRAR
jgi:hypothetical protein